MIGEGAKKKEKENEEGWGRKNSAPRNYHLFGSSSSSSLWMANDDGKLIITAEGWPAAAARLMALISITIIDGIQVNCA